MHLFKLCLMAAVCAPFALAQLTMDQKITDFQYLSGLYAKRYGPYEWKRDQVGFDLLNLSPWLDRVRKTKSDLDFYDLATEYVSSLNDAHDGYLIPSNFTARLNFGVDLYDGKILVEAIGRTRLPAGEFPFLIGYELVSIDGQDAQKLADGLMRYEIAANNRSTRRFAVNLLTVRPQQLIASAPSVPEISTVVFKRPDGKLESYRIPWTRTGLPLTNIGQFTTPKSVVGKHDETSDGDVPAPAYPDVLRRLLNCRLPDHGIIGFGSQTPVFLGSLLSPTFVIRQGRSSADPFFSGTFNAAGYKVGYIRIPTFAPANTTAAINIFATEIVFMQANTDGLVIDVMRNGGGDGAYTNVLLSLLMPTTWRAIPFAVRSTSDWVVSCSSSLESTKAAGDTETAALLKPVCDELIAANKEGRLLTKPLPLDDVTIDREPLLDSKGNFFGYSKPLMVLADELSASAAEIFAATIQDNARGPIFGWRTMGAGGNVESWEAGSYSQATTSVTESLMIRKANVTGTEYLAAPYVENIGVRPDINIDYMTLDNLTNNGKPFYDAFNTAIIDHIRKNK